MKQLLRAERPLCALTQHFLQKFLQEQRVFHIFSVAKVPSQKSQTKGALRRAMGGEWGSHPSVHPRPLSSQIHRQMLPIERQVPLVFELISQASPPLGAIDEVQVRGQVTEAPGRRVTVSGWAPTPLFPSPGDAEPLLPLPPPSFICAVWRGNQVRERGRKKRDPANGKERNVAYFEPFPGTGFHLVYIISQILIKCPLCAQPCARLCDAAAPKTGQSPCPYCADITVGRGRR